MMRLACIGECMVELREETEGRFVRGFGGDTLNTAIYLARLGMQVDYVTALGDDPWSQEMAASWQAEGVGTDLVIHCAGAMPGLYVIQTDPRGERRFLYWRDSAAARRLFALPETDALVRKLTERRLIYYSGVSLSLYGNSGRARLFETLEAARAQGATIAFDTNFRRRGWPDREEAQAAYEAALGSADLVFASVEDLEMLYDTAWPGALAATTAEAELVLKLPDLSCRVRLPDGKEVQVGTRPVARVVDTTAAGDSFAAGYIAARVRGAAPHEAAAAGHRLAGTVVGYPGAIIPRQAMPKAA
ncbi:sugar kinase [Acidocella sp.]|jgi:2-dehydro-3-deoxygluconokinase|uniref:sugar kinase n=1 Tax=Acidocella sp. TaxID=50710 RepID=UPI002F41707A